MFILLALAGQVKSSNFVVIEKEYMIDITYDATFNLRKIKHFNPGSNGAE